MAQTTSFPRSIFAKLSPHEFLVANLQTGAESANTTTKPARTNGRAPNQARQPKINTGSLSHAHGSAIVRNGDTTVICGVRGEILPVTHIPHYRPRSAARTKGSSPEEGEEDRDGRKELKNYDLLVPNIELATGCAPNFLPGVPPSALAQTLSTRVYSLLHTCGLLSAEDLRIWHSPKPKRPGSDGGERMEEEDEDQETEEEAELKAYWALYIDLLFISFDGNPFDVAWAAVVAALRDTKLPKAWWDVDREMVMCSRAERKPLSVRGLPIACSAAVLMEREHGDGGKHWVLLDPDRLEESLCDETVTVVVDRSQGEASIRSISKSGGMIIGLQLLRQFAGLAESRWMEFRAAMEQDSDVRMTLS